MVSKFENKKETILPIQVRALYLLVLKFYGLINDLLGKFHVN